MFSIGVIIITDMKHEVRISYLCTKADTGRLSLDEECELLGYIALEPYIFRMILSENLLLKWRRDEAG